MDRTSTSYVERQNLTMRMAIRRMTGLTKCLLQEVAEPPRGRSAYYNLVRRHQTLRVTPAMAAGVTDSMWSMDRCSTLRSPRRPRELPEARPGAPRLPKGEAKGAVVSVRMTAEEHAAVVAAAGVAGVGLSEWARAALIRAVAQPG